MFRRVYNNTLYVVLRLVYIRYIKYVLCSQLRYDGYVTAAQSVSHTIASYPPTSPSSRLSHLVQLGLKVEGEGK